MKIVHVEDHFDPEAGYQINELIRASKKFNDDVTVITSEEMVSFHKTLNEEKDRLYEKEMNVKILRLKHKFKISSRLYIPGIFKEIEKINPDIVYLHGIGDFKDLILLKRKKNYLIVRDCHMSWVASKNKFNKMFYYLYSRTFSKIINKTNKYKKVFALGNEEYEYLKAMGIRDEKIDYLKHGYSKEVMYYDENQRNIIREQYEIKSDEIVISYVGKFNYNKRPDYIFDIINEIPLNDLIEKKIVLLFIGSKESKYMEEVFTPKLKKFNGEIKVILDGYKQYVDLYKYFSASDICVFPEETTLSSLHAQICGNPVLMTDYDSNKERVINNKNLFRKKNFLQASNNILRIIQNNEIDKKRNLIDEPLKEREYSNQIRKIRSLLIN